MQCTTIGNQKKNIIFLDIDGVLNGLTPWFLLGWKLVCFTKSSKLKSWYANWTDPYGVHKSKVKRLAKIVRATNAKVVMSSSWRFGWWNTPYEEQYADQRKLTDLLTEFDIEVIDITPQSMDGRRDKEILAWLSKNEDIVLRYVILDDERYELECFVGSHLVHTSAGRGYVNAGLKRKHVKQAIEILSR